MDDAKRAAEEAARKAKDAWEDITDKNDDHPDTHGTAAGRTKETPATGDNSQPAADTRRADAESGNAQHQNEMGEQLRRDP
ncbi:MULTISPECIES: hypothetical protein [Microbacterium]|uniref:CsbD family protein n=2 Tax=Microbacteriaceae TaxID=85023 RepID=A0ABX5SUR3_9MICO|nr:MULTISPECIES: hypothetical protein [Microbacterium]QBR89925.1 hypothetical protein E4K62_15275 [Microbacterium wangchenii]